MKIHRDTISSSGIELNCYCAGSGQPMLFLHGHPDCGIGWIHQIEQFGQNYRVIAPDLRGCGHSGKPRALTDYSIEKLIGDILAVIERYEIDDLIFVGHDWGGIIGWYFAAYNPNLIENLITICAPHPAEYIRAFSDDRQKKAALYINEILTQKIFKVGFETFDQRFPNEPERAMFLEAMKETDFRAVANYYRAFMRDSPIFPLKGIPKIKAPTLVIHAKNDPAIIDTAYKNTHRWVDNEVKTVEVPANTHFPHQEHANCVNSAISAWLTELSPTGHIKNV